MCFLGLVSCVARDAHVSSSDLAAPTVLGMFSQSKYTAAALFLQWKGFGPGNHHTRPEPGGPLAHYSHCMPLDWPPANMRRLEQQGIPEDAGQAVSIVKYGKTIANRFWTSHASTAHGFMYRCGSPSACCLLSLCTSSLDSALDLLICLSLILQAVAVCV